MVWVWWVISLSWIRREKHMVVFVINDIRFNVFCSKQWSSNKTTVKHPLITFGVSHLTWALRDRQGCCREITALLSICPSISASLSPNPPFITNTVAFPFRYQLPLMSGGYCQVKPCLTHSANQSLGCFLRVILKEKKPQSLNTMFN